MTGRRTCFPRPCPHCGRMFVPPNVKQKTCSQSCGQYLARGDVRDRLMSRVIKTDGCWVWTGSGRSKMGHGVMRFKRRPIGVHRISYELHIGPIPAGMWVLHKCDNPPCVNPDHLFLGTCDDNNKDKARKGRAKRFLGEAHPAAKLKAVDVQFIRSSGLAVAELARMFGVSQSTIEDAIARRTWTHVA